MILTSLTALNTRLRPAKDPTRPESSAQRPPRHPPRGPGASLGAPHPAPTALAVREPCVPQPPACPGAWGKNSEARKLPQVHGPQPGRRLCLCVQLRGFNGPKTHQGPTPRLPDPTDTLHSTATSLTPAGLAPPARSAPQRPALTRGGHSADMPPGVVLPPGPWGPQQHVELVGPRALCTSTAWGWRARHTATL